MILRRLFFLFLFFSIPLFAQTQPSTNQSVTQSSSANTENEKTNPPLVAKLAILAGLSLLPFAIMLLTSFMKIVIVLSLFRQALGVQQVPPNQLLTGISLLMTIYVMFPTGLAMYNASQDVIKS